MTPKIGNSGLACDYVVATKGPLKGHHPAEALNQLAVRRREEVAALLKVTVEAVKMAEWQALQKIRAGKAAAPVRVNGWDLATGRHLVQAMRQEVENWRRLERQLTREGKLAEAEEVRAAITRWDRQLALQTVLVEPTGRLTNGEGLHVVGLDGRQFYFRSGEAVSTTWTWQRLRNLPEGCVFGRFWILAIEAEPEVPEPVDAEMELNRIARHGRRTVGRAERYLAALSPEERKERNAANARRRVVQRDYFRALAELETPAEREALRLEWRRRHPGLRFLMTAEERKQQGKP